MGYTLSLTTAAAQAEGQTAGTPAKYTFSLTRGAGDAVETSYSYQIWQVDSNGQPTAVANSDFSGISAITNGAAGGARPGGLGAVDQLFTWTASETTMTLTIDSTLDLTVEESERFQVWFFRENGNIHERFNDGLSFSPTTIITLTNDDIGPPVFSSSATFNAAENQTTVGTVAASAPNGANTYTITGGADGFGGLDLFNINATTGALTFKTAPDAEVPDDAGGDRIYNLQVTATSGGQATVQNVVVNLTNVNETPSFTTAGPVVIAGMFENDNTTVFHTPTASTAPANLSEFGGTDTLTYTLGGADAAFFAINSSTGGVRFSGTGANFEATRSSTYNFSIIATDTGALTATQTVQVAIGDVAEGPVISSNGGGDFGFVSVNENTTTTIATVVAVDQDPVGPPLPVITYSISGGADGVGGTDRFDINGATGALTFKPVAVPNYELPTDANTDNQYIVEVTATSAAGGTDTQTLYVNVQNVIESGVPSDVPSSGGGTFTPVPVTNAGNDQVSGTNGDDSIDGGTGDDTINGGVGLDWIDGGEGADYIFGGQNNDFVRGLNGNDIIYGDEGDDDINGNQGEDDVYGGSGADTVRGGQGDDDVYGGEGNDGHVNGNIGSDIVRGEEGDDTCYGGQDNDTVYGDGGNDRLSGDLGNDVLWGGTGADRYVMLATGGTDWVADFSALEGDKIMLATGQAYTVVNASNQVFIQLAGGGGIGLAGVAFSSFSTDWIVFGA